mgnify:CR=1 FL=1
MNILKGYLATETDELKRLILENPELPIVILADEDSSNADYGWTYCSRISFYIEEILDWDFYDYNDTVITDRDRLEEIIADNLDGEYLTDEEYEAAIKHELEKYEPYWKKVIAIYASN